MRTSVSMTRGSSPGVVLQPRRHGDVLPEGAAAGGEPEPHAAEADGGPGLHGGSPARLPSDSGQLGSPAVPETFG